MLNKLINKYTLGTEEGATFESKFKKWLVDIEQGVNSKDTKIVNVRQATNISFIEEELKIVLNFCNNISLDVIPGKLVADYCYVKPTSKEEFEVSKQQIQKIAYENLFISPFDEEKYPEHHWVNSQFISSISVDSKRSRVIFNITNSVSKSVNGRDTLMNDFVFWNFETNSEMIQALKHVYSELEDIVDVSYPLPNPFITVNVP